MKGLRDEGVQLLSGRVGMEGLRDGGVQLPSGRVGAPRPLRHEGLHPVTSPGAGRQRGGAG